MRQTSPFQNFEVYYSKLDAFYMDVCEADNKLTETVKQLAREVALMQLVAMADTYRTDITELLLRAKPNFLRNQKEKMTHDLILSFGSWESLQNEIVRIEVEGWTRNVGYARWISRLKTDHLLPSLVIEDKDLLQIEEVIATRNVLTHHKGIIDQGYLERSGNWYKSLKIQPPKLGTVHTISHNYYKESARCLSKVLRTIDAEAVSII